MSSGSMTVVLVPVLMAMALPVIPAAVITTMGAMPVTMVRIAP
ncbi:hypothetical protein [Comamonas suwonensis]|nr:hypothetical protein [Comamonas suwonensis]